jgi:hypothetical protein
MDLTRFGPFAEVMAVALALIAAFSTLLLKMFGTVRRWTWLSSGAPSFMVSAGARGLAVALMAVTYVTISKTNYPYFGIVAVICGLLMFISIARFDRMRERHVVQIPLTGGHGQQIGQQTIVVGLEQDIREPAKTAYLNARKDNPSLSLITFMAGFGSNPYDPHALWDPTSLADLRNSLTVTLMSILLFGVLVLYLAAFIIVVKQH